MNMLMLPQKQTMDYFSCFAVLLTVGLASITGCAFSISKGQDMLDIGATYREMNAAFFAFAANHNGAFPTNLQSLVDYCRQTSMKTTTLTKDGDWTKFIYIANLNSNDPSDAPRILYIPVEGVSDKGMIGFLGGGIRWAPRRTIVEIAQKPWLGIEGAFQDDTALREFKQRVQVILPK